MKKREGRGFVGRDCSYFVGIWMVGFGRACVYVVRNQGLELSYEMVCLFVVVVYSLGRDQ